MIRSTTRPSFRPRLLGLLVLLIGALPIAASGLTDFGRAAAVTLSDANATVVVPAAMQLVPSAPERSVSPRRVSSGGSGTAPQISTGRSHTCALLTDGTVRCWGFNALGVLGDGTTLVRSNPVQVLTSGDTQGTNVLSGVTQLATGRSHTCALLTDGSVRCWGGNAYGQLGDGTTVNRSSPVAVLTSGDTQGTNVLSGVTQISADVFADHTCALLTDATVRCWGRNSRGGLGDGTTVDRSNPVEVLASGDTQGTNVLPGVAQVSAGFLFTCAVLTNGTANCWGSNFGGALGDGTTTNRSNPVQVLASGDTQGVNVLAGVKHVSAGGDSHVCALLTDDTVNCWGSNDSGQLGDGTTVDRSNPVEVLASGDTQGTNVLGGVAQVSAGEFHTCAVLTDGTARCWGANPNGQLGDGTAVDRSNPVQVLASGDTQGANMLAGVAQIAASTSYTCALLTDGTANCWGFNRSGKLGDGTFEERLNPVQVLTSGTAIDRPVVFSVVVLDSSSGTASSTASSPSLSVACSSDLQVRAVLTCAVTGGEPGIDILWRASYNPVIAEAGVTLDASGSGEFSFTVPAAAVGQAITVELVDWTAPVSLGVAGGPVPSSVPSGGSPFPVWLFGLAALAVLGVRRRAGATPVGLTWPNPQRPV
jgi:alpha-tubulin suppressor-like RCC1 family protein